MPNKLSILMAQTNPTIGAIDENCARIIEIIKNNQESHDLIIFPELALTGYMLEDLLFRESFLTKTTLALEQITAIVNPNCHVIIGHPAKELDRLYNRASIISNKAIVKKYDKQKLPNYGIFDELRYYTAGFEPCLFTINNYKLQLCICEDLWQSEPKTMLNAATEILISINASPFDTTKAQRRIDICHKYASLGVNVIYVNQVGGNDELVFDGNSFMLKHDSNILNHDSKIEISQNSHGSTSRGLSAGSSAIVASLDAFKEHLQTVTIANGQISSSIAPQKPQIELIYQALVCGLKDYVTKNNFKTVLLGLSGGIDSALTLALAVDALGKQNVTAILLPSRYTANISLEDALLQLKAQDVSYINLSIENTFSAILDTLNPIFKDYKADKTEENIQARIRGLLLMAIANKTNSMLLSTSNKSESAVGYTTLYGDMAGGYAPIKDVLKTTVYELAKYRNQISKVIPDRVITRPPSAELAFNQKDEDSLPPYAILDAIIAHYMHDNFDADKIIALGYQSDIVNHVIKLITINEHKRHQAPPGTKITPCAFGKDWRRSITCGF
jgi:NAD+ synthase (glutamine-hydrolysing)